ncbi:cellulose synthase operon protein YhjQ/BcsQ [Salinicola avicenniae]|uniref:cellulose synthase operon protein YhjQ/BcsQ n=1 Tax=Salinicola avicenniae TaxID=2916836 RepID=UPI002072A9D4|nr:MULTISPECIES: cellulose synthase operon protein YhjQ/BcsQ [unclassified Salinicola]
MPLIQFVSPKGGVGRTSLCVNLGVALGRLGYSVFLVDLDPQNALIRHFALPGGGEHGLIDYVDGFLSNEQSWRHLSVPLEDMLSVVPFGSSLTLPQRQASLASPGWLLPRLRSLEETSHTLVLVDTSVLHDATSAPLTQAADLTLVTLMADAGSLAILPQWEAALGAPPPAPWKAAHTDGRLGYLINQIDSRSPLKREIAEMMLERFSPELVGAIHRDEAMSEALADQRPVILQSPFSAAAHDIEQAARAVASRFPLYASGGVTATDRQSAG